MSISSGWAQQDSTDRAQDSVNSIELSSFEESLRTIIAQRKEDSLMRLDLQEQLQTLKTTDTYKKDILISQLRDLSAKDSLARRAKIEHVDSLRKITKSYAVVGPLQDTLFRLYSRIGASMPQERAAKISDKIKSLYKDDHIDLEKIKVMGSANMIDIVYEDMIIMSVSEMDAIWNETSSEDLANNYSKRIKTSIAFAIEDGSLLNSISRIGLVLLALGGTWLLLWAIGKGHRKLLRFIATNKDRWLKDLSYHEYTFLSAYQELKIIIFASRLVKWAIYVIVLYIAMPLVFSIFPFTRGWSRQLFDWIWSPFKSIFVSIYEFLPSLFTIIAIYLVMRYVIRFVRYIFEEIENEKLVITGFHSDWSKPTYNIVRFLLYAFTFVMIFPHLPGSQSDAFKGVSVFIGILFSLGSSTAIANMIAGLVITYMRPFKLGDRIKIGETTGDVVEKTLLVTRLKTIKNEEITIPNSALLTGNTINYSSYSQTEGLIVHTTVTIGYDVPWQQMYETLLEAALRTPMIQKDPKPFVLQTSLDDFYVAYQVNAYTKEASKQALVYSLLHQNIQDVCNENGIEIMSPHYRAQRDGGESTIPASYSAHDERKKNYQLDPEKEKI
ncbi:ion channel [Echinicola pacifica]|uniref:Ion channel n=2 Tax=Echinicola pacifica TaxID=346377 RepID=A0A918PRN6_9BACT|nr:ion channel [Echinicola pacifica]